MWNQLLFQFNRRLSPATPEVASGNLRGCLRKALSITLVLFHVFTFTFHGLSFAQGGESFSSPVSAIQNFHADPSTGMASTSVPIVVPPGRKGIQPNIALTYSSSSKNSWLGFGWMFDLGHIERSTKDGIPTYTDSDTFYFASQGANSELVYIGGDEYRAKIESGFLRFSFDGSSWVVTDKGGTQYHFGSTSDSRLDNPSGTLKYLMDKVVDIHGNYLAAYYNHDDANGQAYLSEIQYTGNEVTGISPTKTIQFILEGAQRPDVVLDYRSGYRIATTKRLSQILTRANSQLAAKYSFNYKYSPRTGRSLLTKVTKYGSDGTSEFPSPTFIYADENAPTYSYQYTEPNQGDNLWNARHAGGYDRGHENYGAVPPYAFDVNWGETYTQSSYSGGGWNFDIESNGSLYFWSAQDSASHFWTYVYVDQEKILNVPYSTYNGGPVGLYLNGDYAQELDRTWELKPGYNLIEITGYHQHDNYAFDLNYALADNVMLMNSSQFSIPQLSADFNSDGITDLGTYYPADGKWEISLSNGANFQPQEPWISDFGTSTMPLLGDFNADGKTDICAFNQSEGGWQVALSSGAKFDADGVWLDYFGQDEKPISGDFNGDGRVDVGYFDQDYGDWYIAFSSGSSFNDQGRWLSGFGEGEAPFVGDFNGDGLTDISYFDKDSGRWYAALCNGREFIAQGSIWISGFATDFDGMVLDYNGDGLTDIGYFDRPNARVVVARCTGSGFENKGDWISGLRVTDYGATVQTGDFNGDGLVDPFIYNPYTEETELGLSQGDAPDLLGQIDNGLGGDLLIQYAPSSAYDNTGDDNLSDVPFVFQTIKESRVSDGMGNSYKTTYHYKGAYYDTDKKDFRGFSYVKITDDQGNYTETHFNQSEIFKGKPKFSETKDKDNNLYTRTDFSWQSSEPYFGVDFPYLYETNNYIYNIDSTYKQTTTQYEYDDYGNLTRVIEQGDFDVDGDERETITEYVYNTEDWVIALPCHSYVLDYLEEKVLEKWFYYDDNPWWTNAPTKGELTKEEVWLDSSDERISTRYSYDLYGNLTSVTDALGRTTQTEYEGACYIYPERITNALGHTLEYTYSQKTGQVLTTTDTNCQVTETIYDVHGRPVKVIGSNDTNALPSVEYEYDLTSVPNKVIKHIRIVSGAPEVLTSYSFYDGAGRALEVKTDAEDPANQILSGVAEYDHRSLVTKQYLPYFVNKSSSYIQPDYVYQPYTEFEYDCLGRAIKVTNPDDTFSTVEHSDWSVTQTDENGNYTTRVNDAYGRLVEVREYNEGEEYTTTYTYDTFGNLIEVVDDHGNTTQIFYDSLGRKVSMDDPDMGEWSYEYDAVGNLIRQTDAKGQIINFEYDELNRLTKKWGLSPQGTVPIFSVTYSYDNPTVANSIGRLTRVIDSSGRTEFYYDNLGRETKTIKQISGANYTVERTYDALDRLTSVKYPDSEIVNYLYNQQGAIEAVYSSSKTYVLDVDYNALGQLTYIEYGNGTYSEYTYDSETMRLYNLKTNDGVLQDFIYSYDNIGNVTGIEDYVNTGTQDFIYDDLNRLTSATGSYGSIDYEYDSIGNLTGKGSVSFSYGENGAGPHAVTSSSAGKSFNYDANGSMITRAGQELEYDSENRLISITGQVNAEIQLQYGWNFISIPIVPEDASVESVLSSLTFDHDYNQVTRYNQDTSEFEHYVGNPKFNDFDTLEYGRGYQIHVTNPNGCTLNLSGSAPKTNKTLQLKQGWNLIGSPTASQVPVEQALSGVDYDEVTWYNPVTEAYEYNITHFEKGKAYAIHCLRDTTWVISQQSGSATFVYDGDGGRVKKRESGTTTTYVGSLYETDSTGAKTKHIFLGSNRIATASLRGAEGDEAISISYYHSDHIGSSNIITDKDGQQAQLLEYTPFGTTSRNEGTHDTSYRFTGKPLDQSTGLYYYGARYYDPELGRFISADTIVQAPSNPQTLNRYSYCNNNPINYVDPTGHGWFKKFWQSVVGVAGIVASIAFPVLAPAMWAINMGMGAYTAAQTGNWMGFAGSIIGGAVFGAIGKSLASSISGTMSSNFANSFAGGAIIGAVEFGTAGFGAGLVGGLAGGASVKDSFHMAGIGSAMGAASGAIIQGSYMAGWQDSVHGLSKGEYVQARLNRAGGFMRSCSTGRAANILGDLQKNYDMALLGIKQFGPGGTAIHPDVYASSTSGSLAGVGFDFSPKTSRNFASVLAGGEVGGVFSAKDFSNISNMSYDLLVLKSADPAVVNRAIPIIESYVGRSHYYKLYGKGAYTCQDGAAAVLSDIGL